jgi:endonuclease G
VFTSGTYHSAEDITRYVRNGQTEKGLTRNLNGGHGTHVASIAAGRRAGDFAGGVAPEARLLVVISGGQGPIGYSSSHLEALAFIDREATQLGLPVVVNVSQGMNAGAHDGKSALEVAFDEFSKGGRRPGRVIVKSAGNERGDKKRGHAKVTVGQSSREELRWERDPRAGPVERLELWWSSADAIEFRLCGPGLEWTDWVGPSNPQVPGTVPGAPPLMQFIKRHVDNGDSQLKIEIDRGEEGTWRLQIRSGAVPEGGEIHAWIERSSGVPSIFVNHPDEEMTLSIPGTAQNVITVGAVGSVDDNGAQRAVNAGEPIAVGDFSSYGPTRDRRQKPDVCAPGVEVRAARAGTSTSIIDMKGTSMAAPHVTGAIALLLSRTAAAGGPIPTSTQIASALRQKTKNYTSRWDRGQGFGVVDVAALLAAF